MNSQEIYAKHSALLVGLAAALNLMGENGEIATKAKQESAKSITAKLKQFAALTAAEGDSVEEARKALNGALVFGDVKEGTRKASGNHFAGYRAMLADGVTSDEWNSATNAIAQQYIASPDIKRKNLAKREWNKHTKDWDADRWDAFLLEQGVRVAMTGTGTTDTTGEGVTASEQIDLAAAVALAEAQAAEGETETARTGTEG